MIVFTITRPDGDIETLKTSRSRLTAGSAYTDDITLLDQDISPEHGVFEIVGDVVIYTDTGFGTQVNNREIVGEKVALTPDDDIRIGDEEVIITYRILRDENTVTSEPGSFETDFSDKVTYPHSKPAHTQAPSPPETEPADSISSSESPPSWMEQRPDTASSEASAPYKAPSGEKLLRMPSSTPRNIEIDNERLALTIVVLMLFFWPFGLLVNFLAWLTGDKQGANFGYIRILMLINFLIALVVAYLIGGWISS